jgi:deoxyribodipyrimidine photo-lyase
MSSPLTAAETCSRLSPHLALGTVSVREAARAAAARAAEIAAAGLPGLRRDMESFAARLAWRDHFIQKMEDAPDIEARCLHPAFEGLRPREPDAARLAAWARGETGFPFVDACMRSLAGTGWLNFRMRAMLMAVAGYHLWLDWRGAGMHLARLFTDYEPGIHWSQCQMQTGVTGINALRIYNPVKQGLDQDPAGRFTRAWVPELAAVPDAFLQAPWAWEGAGRILGARYPEPVVDPVAAVRAAKAAIADVRAGAAFAAEAARVARRHGSRKDRGPGRHFVNDRQKAPRRRAPGQMEFDF